MSEKIQPHNLEQEAKKELPPSLVVGWTVNYADEPNAPRVQINRDSRHIIVNRALIANVDEARRVGVFAAAQETALAESLRGASTKEAMLLFSKDPSFTRELLRLTGARILAEREPKIAKDIANHLAPAGSALGEFKTACALYLATSSFPPTTEAVRAELEKLPIARKTGAHLLSSFTNPQNTPELKLHYFTQYIAPAFERLRQIDADLRASDAEDFQPSTDDPENGELNESEIMQRIEPYVGGYFREKVMDAVDWQTMKVVATGVPSERLLPPDEPRQQKADQKTHRFTGRNGSTLTAGELPVALPASAFVHPETATVGIAIRRGANGTHTLEWTGEGAPPDEYQFVFERTSIPLDWQKTEPTQEERDVPATVTETLSEETRAFLEEIKSARITDEARVRQIARRVQTSIEYVNNSEVGETLMTAGAQYFSKLEQIKKGDCDVSNFYALAQIRSLDIPCRMVTGYHVSHDKRFSFAALAGVKHAWLEWWNKDSGLWERIDATPPKSPSEEDEGKTEGGGGGDDKEMRLDEREEGMRFEPEESDDDPWGLPFEKEDLERLREQLGEVSESDVMLPASQIFEDLHGLSLERWEEVRAEAEAVGRERIPREATVEKLAYSTVAQEWQRIFDLLLIAYHLPVKTSWVMGRESQGGELTDPVSAGIDVMLGAEDPYGYEKKKRFEQVEKLPVRFSNDFLLDVTASMQARNQAGKSLLELERQFVISSLYEGYRLNERVKQRASALRAVPLITNHILSIHGGGKWQEILKTKPMSLQELVAVDEVMKKTAPGAGAMAEAIEAYVKTLEEDQKTIDALENKEMVKTLTILTDGNLWCSACGKESCNYELHGPILARVQTALAAARQHGVIINVIGFTKQSRPVTELFAVKDDLEAAVVVEDLAGALEAHHKQVLRAMKPALEVARKKLGTNPALQK